MKQHPPEQTAFVALGRITRSVAHDFNNALTSILSSAELLREDTPEEDPRSADILRICRACMRARALTVQLLDLTEPREFSPERIAVVPRIRTRLDFLERTLARETVELRGDDSISIVADPSGFDESLLQLALFASTLGGDTPKLALSVTQSHDGVTLMVKCSGRLAEGDLAYVFDPSVDQRFSLNQVFRFAKEAGGNTDVRGDGDLTAVELTFPNPA